MSTPNRIYRNRLPMVLLLGVAAAGSLLAQPASAQTQPAQVAQQQLQPQPGQAQAAAIQPLRPPFDMTAQPGEHPLTPVLRLCRQGLAHIDQNVADYSCTLVKQERLDGELGDTQTIDMKVRHQPFSVHMKFRQPHAGREVVYVDGQNDGKLIALEAGLTGRLTGPLSLDPTGILAMRGQKYPITNVGIRNLMAEFIRRTENDLKYEESIVKSNPNFELFGRSTTLVQVTHPVPRQTFSCHIARVFIDNELLVPIYYDAYSWPTREGESPPLIESYAYRNLKLNNGFTARDFVIE